jgi:hypothetical protein
MPMSSHILRQLPKYRHGGGPQLDHLSGETSSKWLRQNDLHTVLA